MHSFFQNDAHRESSREDYEFRCLSVSHKTYRVKNLPRRCHGCGTGRPFLRLFLFSNPPLLVSSQWVHYSKSQHFGFSFSSNENFFRTNATRVRFPIIHSHSVHDTGLVFLFFSTWLITRALGHVHNYTHLLQFFAFVVKQISCAKFIYYVFTRMSHEINLLLNKNEY